MGAEPSIGGGVHGNIQIICDEMFRVVLYSTAVQYSSASLSLSEV